MHTFQCAKAKHYEKLMCYRLDRRQLARIGGLVYFHFHFAELAVIGEGAPEAALIGKIEGNTRINWQ